MFVVGVVGVRMAVVVGMVVAVIVAVIVGMVVIRHFQPAGPGAKIVTQRTIRHVRARRRGPLAFHMVMMALLYRANVRFESEHLNAVLAHAARGRRRLACLLQNTRRESLKNSRMVVEVARFYELYPRMFRRQTICKPVNSINMNTQQK